MREETDFEMISKKYLMSHWLREFVTVGRMGESELQGEENFLPLLPLIEILLMASCLPGIGYTPIGHCA